MTQRRPESSAARARGRAPQPAAPADPAAAPQRAAADVGGVAISYLDSGGDGPPVVLLHSGSGSSLMWEHQWLPLIAAGLRVIAYDRRGYGATVVAQLNGTVTPADDLESLLDYLKLDRVHLLGTAAGGIVATDFALSSPARLHSLVIANSHVGIQDEEYLAVGRRLRPPEFGKLPPDLRELGPVYRAANPEGTQRWLALERQSLAPGSTMQLPRSRSTLTFAALGSITVPTLLITGDADSYLPPPMLQLFTDRIRHAETLVIAQTGHSAYWEQPALFNRGVIEFIQRHSPGIECPTQSTKERR